MAGEGRGGAEEGFEEGFESVWTDRLAVAAE